MNQKMLFLSLSLFFAHYGFSVASVEKIMNHSRFIFDIVRHASDSPCALFAGNIKFHRIHPEETFDLPVIMQKGDSVTLRPVAYFDDRLQEFIHMYDDNGIFSDEAVSRAYVAWKYQQRSRKKYTKALWMKKWVGGDIVVSMKEELCGYMLHIIHAATANYQHIDHAWPVYSQGAYSALGVELVIDQDETGIVPRLYSTGSRGVMCQNGEIVDAGT
jgi:hypothetical protein